MGARFVRFHSFYPAESKAARTVFTTTFFSKKIIALMLHGVHFSKIEICMFFQKISIFSFFVDVKREKLILSCLKSGFFKLGPLCEKAKCHFRSRGVSKMVFVVSALGGTHFFFIILMQRGDDKHCFFQHLYSRNAIFMIFQQNHYNPCVILMKICQH